MSRRERKDNRGDIDIEGIRLAKSTRMSATVDSGPPKPRQGDRFLKGPIPWLWLSTAARLPGRALHVAVGLYHRSWLTRSRTVHLPTELMDELGIQRHSLYRALAALEEAGLVSTVRRRGVKPRVTILELQVSDTTTSSGRRLDPRSAD